MRAHRFLFREDIRTIRGIDMHVFVSHSKPAYSQFNSGTGASAIYPLLACKMEPSWDFIATGTDIKPILSLRLLYHPL
jgi:23S rRNA A1618 N6-methylase RlmF